MNLGKVYTKDIVADYMVSLIDLPKNSHIVDPCFGRGVFVKSLIKAGFNNITGVEIDSEAFSSIGNEDFSDCEMLKMDFFTFSPQTTIDGFVLNPPYVRQEEIDGLNVLGVTKESITAKCGTFTIHSKANLYLYFIARCITLLREGGELVSIFPNVWLNTPDGSKFYSQITEHGSVDAIIQVAGFPFVGNPLVDVMILKFTKGANRNCQTMKKTLTVSENNIEVSDYATIANFKSRNCIPLSAIASVRRGVTTGCNKAFTNPPISDSRYLADILSSPKDVHGYTTGTARLDKLLWIKSTNTTLPGSISSYLKSLERQILEKGKPKAIAKSIIAKKAWFSIRMPKPSGIIFPYIIRDTVRFIHNDRGVIVRDNFYTIDSTIDSLLLMALLNNLYVYSQLESLGKSYGSGLLKIQKYDIDKIVIPNPTKLNKKNRSKLIDCSKKLIETGQLRYILEATNIVKCYYAVDNIEDMYQLQKNNRLKI